jgi:uncharacterized protein (TIGR02145 family)
MDGQSFTDPRDGTDDFGFSALPGGHGNSGGSFYNVGNGGYWWSANEYDYDSDYAYYRYMYYNHAYTSWDNNYKSYLRSVRCIKD